MKERTICRGDLFYYDFGTRTGSIQSGERPVLVIQADDSGISRAGLLKMINHNDCPFVLRLGHRRLIKRRAFDEYITKLDFVE